MSVPRRRRRRRDPVAVGDMLGAWRRRGEGAQDPALDAVRAAWPAAVGDAVAARAQPVRRSRAGVVTVACADAVWAQELASRGEDIADQIRAAAPDADLAGLRFVADEHALRAPGAPPPAPPAPPPLRPDEIAAAAHLVDGVQDPRLRELLARIAAASRRPGRGGETPPPDALQGGHGRGG
ncbi:MAG: DUF721 domain-containing protein [Actinomycetota bacterium]